MYAPTLAGRKETCVRAGTVEVAWKVVWRRKRSAWRDDLSDSREHQIVDNLWWRIGCWRKIVHAVWVRNYAERLVEVVVVVVEVVGG